ncbi:hypothetical protein KNP65_02210 [Latilactobacillus curvatus]|uniref:hypothetical protein n=1 Tax=Latilactobacillus curvatus TaxID=28038 RepID=UPI002410D4F3|nr:hypothetical protein [Latilactobacillus curvatus]MDG2978751.1 hypothetical protein [Latilactobacillus curvatus]
MKKIDEVSLRILMEESNSAYWIMYQITKGKIKDESQLSISLLPFLSSVCDGWLMFFKLQNLNIVLPEINNISFEKYVQSTRVSYKLYSDKKVNRINRTLKKSGFERLRLLITNYNIIQRIFIKLFGQEDLGVFCFIGTPYGNTSQLSIYLDKLVDIESTSSLSEYNDSLRPVLIDYSKILSTLINSVVNNAFKDKVGLEEIEQFSSVEFQHKDYFFYDKRRKNILGGFLPRDTQLFLFDIYCQNNFINNVMPLFLKESESLFYRSKLQTYLTSINSLILIQKKYKALINSEQTRSIERIIKEKEEYFTLENKLRNNIFHYGIEGVPVSVFKNPNCYFKELVEYSVRLEFNEFIERINSSLDEINQIFCNLILWQEGQ